MSDLQTKQQIERAIGGFRNAPLLAAARALFEVLGYRSTKRIDLPANSAAAFVEAFDRNHTLNPDTALLGHWRSVDMLFQITVDDLRSSPQTRMLFDLAAFNTATYQSFVFFAIQLADDSYPRTQLAAITREVNKLFPMPVSVLFRHGAALTLAIVTHRPHKRDHDRDVLEKVTLIKDIALQCTHRAQIEILYDLSLEQLHANHAFADFDGLQQAWRQTLDISALNRRFYRDLADWYFWAIGHVQFPADPDSDAQVRNATSVIRLITQLIFVWFLREKGLVPDALFRRADLKKLLTTLADDDSSYYKAILQNLFFATLNQEQRSAERPDNRTFRNAKQNDNLNLYCYRDLFTQPDAALKLFASVPFLNGGLFECLDKLPEGSNVPLPVDGFSDRPDNPLRVPNFLFFGAAPEVDRGKVYDSKTRSRTNLRGLIDILEHYKFTIAENTPIEHEVALDPELLGQVFENLLASYNPETETTARKQTGSFYTPREIVNYMVDESLVAYLESHLVAQASSLASHTTATHPSFLVPDAPIDISRRTLPHWRQQGVIYFVTFRLADSLPQQKLQEFRDQRDAWLTRHRKPYTQDEQAEYDALFGQRVEKWLDAGAGSCALRDPALAQIVGDALRHFDGQRYHLDAWVVMPNHVHVLVTPFADQQLSGILHTWKSFTSNRINRALGRSGGLWQEESYDRIVRNPAELERIRQYIADNPARAGIGVGHALSGGQDAGAMGGGARPFPDGQDARATLDGQDAGATLDGRDAGATLTERLRHLLGYNDEPPRFGAVEVRAMIVAIDHVKILDPACGSGAFPMGMLQKLVYVLGKLDPDNQHWREQQRQRAVQETGGAFHIDDLVERNRLLADMSEAFEYNSSDYGRKLYLIENCIYGVDIQPIAVQIAKLRCFIALIVDQQVQNERENRGIRPLPNLETKFVAANTLVGLGGQGGLRGPDVIAKEDALEDVRRRHFGARTPATKRKYRDQDRRLRGEIAALLREEGVSSATASLLARWDPYEQNASSPFFDAVWMFGNDLNDGFDIVIANPPYVRQEQISHLKPLFKSTYDTYTGTADLYVYFYEQGMRLLKSGGVLTYISSNKYFRAGYGEKLRRYLATQATVRQLIDFGDAPIFTAIAYPSIIVATKTAPSRGSEHSIQALTWEPGPPVEEFANIFAQGSFLLLQKELTPNGWRLESPATLRLLEKLRMKGSPFSRYVNGRFYSGIKTGLNEAFVVDRNVRAQLIAEHSSSAELLKPYLRGRDVKRWRVTPDDQYMITIESSENKQHPWSGKPDREAERLFARTYPAIHAWFEPFRASLINRTDQGKYFWEVRSCSYWQEFAKPKIIYPDIAKGSEFAYDKDAHFLGNTLYLLPIPDLWLLGLLNSRSIFWFYSQVSTQIQGGFVRWIAQYVSQIPIPAVHNTKPLESLVTQILAAKAQNANADVGALEREIDGIVYGLYGLTADEIRVVEAGTTI